jgi:hypothetical protein
MDWCDGVGLCFVRWHKRNEKRRSRIETQTEGLQIHASTNNTRKLVSGDVMFDSTTEIFRGAAWRNIIPSNSRHGTSQHRTYAPPPPMVRFWDCCCVCCCAVRHTRFPTWERKKAEDLENILASSTTCNAMQCNSNFNSFNTQCRR